MDYFLLWFAPRGRVFKEIFNKKSALQSNIPTNTDYLSKCALYIKHVDNVSALTPEVNSGQAIVNI